MIGIRTLIPRAPLSVSPRRRMFGLLGVLVLSLVLLAHTVALTLFLWPAGQSLPSSALVFVWLVSLVAFLLLGRLAFTIFRRRAPKGGR